MMGINNSSESHDVDVLLIHNVLWPRYKAVVFSALHRIVSQRGLGKVQFIQIASTTRQRVTLSEVNLSLHAYPYSLLFDGAYSDVGKVKLHLVLATAVWESSANLVILPGYDRSEYWLALLVAVVCGKKKAVFADSTLNDKPLRLVPSILKRLFFKLCDGFFCYGQRAKEHLEYFGVDPAKIHFRNQVAALPVASGEKLGLLRAESDPKFVLYVGRLAPEKGLEDYVFAANRLHEGGVSFSVVGDGPLRNLMHYEDHVEYCGALSGAELVEAYSKASVLVLPSYSEPWGVVVNEALLCGCVVVVSDACGCCPEMVIEGETGYTYPAGDRSALCVSIEKALGLAEREETARRCKSLAKKYSAERSALGIYNGCLAILGSDR